MDSALRNHFVRCLHYDLETVQYTGIPTPWDFIVENWVKRPDRSLPKRIRVIPDQKFKPSAKMRRRVVCQSCGWSDERFGSADSVLAMGCCPRCWGARLRSSPVRPRSATLPPSKSKSTESGEGR
jgi:hypothetical protein